MLQLKANPIGKIKLNATILMSQVADVDKDGILEYVVATHDDSIRILKYNNKNFDEIGQFRLPMSISKFVVEDVDGDGNLEIIIGTRDKVLRIVNFEGGKFNQKAIWKATDPIQDIIVGDAFNKKQPIIIVAAGKFLYFLSFQFGHLQEGDNIRKTRDISGLELADLDNDGLIEVIYGIKDNEIEMIQFQSRFYQLLKGKLRTDYYVKYFGTIKEDTSNKQHLVLSTANGELGIFEFQNGIFLNHLMKKYKGNINSMIICKDGINSTPNQENTKIIIGGSLGDIIIFDYDGDRSEELSIPIKEVITNFQIIRATDSDTQTLIVGCEEGIIFLYNLMDLFDNQKTRKIRSK